MMNLNSKFLKYSTQRLTTTIVPANYYILSVGQVMRVLTKKPHGYLLPNSDMLPKSSQTFTLHTQPSLALCQVFPNSDLQTSSVLHFLRITLFLCSNYSEFLSTVESSLHHKVLPASLLEHPQEPLPDSSPAPFLFPSPSSSYVSSPPALILLALPVSPSPGPSGTIHPM